MHGTQVWVLDSRVPSDPDIPWPDENGNSSYNLRENSRAERKSPREVQITLFLAVADSPHLNFTGLHSVGSSAALLLYSFNWCPPEVSDLKLNNENNGGLPQRVFGQQRPMPGFLQLQLADLPLLPPSHPPTHHVLKATGWKTLGKGA